MAGLLSAQQPTRVNPKDGLTYVWIPPGKFQMGCSPADAECFDNEKPAHQVTITKGFWLGQTAVTQQAYERVIGKNPANHKGANLPVEEVDWNEATGLLQGHRRAAADGSGVGIRGAGRFHGRALRQSG